LVIQHLRRHLIAYLALFVALGGTSYAAFKLPKNTVGSKQIKNNAVTGSKVKNGSLTKADLKRGEIPAAFAGVLPSARSLRGTWAVSGGSDGNPTTVSGAVSFGVVLASAPAPTFVADGDSPSASCPGSVVAPTAARGHLCIYENSGSANVGSVTLRAPGSSTDPSAAPFGTLVIVDSAGDGPVTDGGSWAVTAP
jgi:hypothetical protein